MNKTICFTGGGSSGHVTPNLAIIDKLNDSQRVFYIGSKKGIEKELVKKKNIDYYEISSGKLRRYFSWQNFIDPFKILLGIIQSIIILRKRKPSVVFSKGGFVTFPVAVAAKALGIPVICHESDIRPGLANKLVFPLAEKICITFQATEKNIKYKNKIIYTGAPIREGFFHGDASKAVSKYKLDKNKKTLLIIGGGAGAVAINEVIFDSISELTEKFNVIHLTGKGKLKEELKNDNYIQIEYLHEDLYDVMALADLVISRAGSNALYELILLKKKHILIPLTRKASRGDQIDNANYFKEKKLSYVLEEENLTKPSLLSLINKIDSEVSEYEERLKAYDCPNGLEKILEQLNKFM